MKSKRVKKLIREWEANSKRYLRASNRERNRYDANRYEGIATAYRWAAEDLKKANK